MCDIKKIAAGGVNGPHHFSLRGSDSASPGCRKIPEPWPMPERAKPCGEHNEGIFLPTSKNSSQLEFELTTSWERRYRTELANSAAQPLILQILVDLISQNWVRVLSFVVYAVNYSDIKETLFTNR